jgi:DNA-binding HxlR family transcriptional regulator
VKGVDMTMEPANKPTSCPVHEFQRLINGKYKLRIIWDLQKGSKRYSEIKRGLLTGMAGTDEIAARVLSRELKALTEMGILQRMDYGVIPPKVEYSLTTLGKSLLPIIRVIHRWGTQKFNR